MGYLPIATTVVGRVSELTALAASLDEARAGRGSFTLLGGVPGIGKSRLALEVSGLATRLGMTVLWGRCFEGEGGRSFAPWVEALGGYLRGLEADRLQRQLFGFFIARARLMMGDIVEPPGELPAAGLFRVTVEAASAYATGDWPACRAAATIGLDLARRRGNHVLECWAAHQLARLALVEGDDAGAEDLLQRSLELVAGQHRPWEALVRADLGILYASRGRTDEARAVLNQCRASMRPAFPRPARWRRLRCCWRWLRQWRCSHVRWSGLSP